MLRECGFHVHAMAFERDYYSGRELDCSLETLGKIKHRKYLSRFFKMLAAVSRIRKRARDYDVVYAFGADSSYLSYFALLGLDVPLVVEIADIQPVQVRTGPVGRLVRIVDKLSAGSARLLVSTAPAFVREFYRKTVGVRTSALLLENKLEPGIETGTGGLIDRSLTRQLRSSRNALKIGYFGLLRCDWSFECLKWLSDSTGSEVQVVISGYLAGVRPDAIDRIDGAVNLGPYKAPEDLQELYESVDLVWGCYPKPVPGEKNWKWAWTNRFYEACKFGRPIICLAGSGDSARVEELGIGICVDGEPNEVADEVLRQARLHLDEWRTSIRSVAPSVYEYLDEYRALKQCLTAVALRKELPKEQVF